MENLLCPYNNKKDVRSIKSVLLTDFISKRHRIYITYWQHKLKQFQLNINHCSCNKAFEVLIKVQFTINFLS